MSRSLVADPSSGHLCTFSLQAARMTFHDLFVPEIRINEPTMQKKKGRSLKSYFSGLPSHVNHNNARCV